jgi:hypothetical protein
LNARKQRLRDFSGFSAAKKGARSPQKNRLHHRKIISTNFARFDIRDWRIGSYNGAIERPGSDGASRRRASHGSGEEPLDFRAQRAMTARERSNLFPFCDALSCCAEFRSPSALQLQCTIAIA